MNQAKGGIQTRETIWRDVKRAVPFIKVNANRNEEDGCQKQAFLNILQRCRSTQQLQPSFSLTKTRFTDTSNTCPPHKWLFQALQSGTNVHGRGQRDRFGHFQRGPPCVTTAAGVISGLLHVSFALSEPRRGGEPTVNAYRYFSGKNRFKKRSIFTIKSKRAAPLRSIHPAWI